MHIFNDRKEARALYVDVRGSLLIYLVAFTCLRALVLLPIFSKIWGWILSLTPEQFIYEWNIINIFKNPVVPIAGLLIAFVYCMIQLWELAGIHICLEYHYEGRKIPLLRLFVLSFKKIFRAWHPRNYFLLIYVALIIPFVDAYHVSGLSKSFQIPEYIMDAILASPILSLLTLVGILALLFVALLYFFAEYVFVFEGVDFPEACRKSGRLTKGKRLRVGFKIIFSQLYCWLSCLRGLVLVILGLIGLIFLMGAMTGAEIAIRTVVVQGTQIVLIPLTEVFVKMKQHAYLLTYYHRLEAEAGEETDIAGSLPDYPVRQRKKRWIYAHFTGVLYAVIFLTMAVTYAGINIAISEDPEVALSFFNSSEIFAHKGYSSRAPENTMDAFQLAVDCDVADWIELDVRCTKDNIPIVIHDASIQKGSGEDICVYDVTLEELQQHKIPYDFTDTYPNAVVPTLEEVLSAYGQSKYFLIEIKYDDRAPELPAQIIELVKKYGLEDRVKIHSGSYLALTKVKEIDPDMPCGLIMAIGLGNYYDLPGVDFFSVEHSFVSSDVISQVHLRNKQIYVWTVNDRTSFDAVRYLGVDGVITDYPDDAYSELHSNDADALQIFVDSLDLSRKSENGTTDATSGETAGAGGSRNTEDGDW